MIYLLPLLALLLAYATLSAFYAFAVFAITFYGLYLDGRLSKAPRVLGFPWLVLFVLVDWAINQAICPLLFWDRAQSWRELVTGRMSRYQNGPPGWRYRVGVWVCDKLNRIAVTGKHCT